MQQVSPKRAVRFEVATADHKGAAVMVRPPTQPQLAHIQWRFHSVNEGRDNMGDAAYEACRAHVLSWEGMPGAPRDFDELPVKVAIEVASFIALGCQFTEDDAKN